MDVNDDALFPAAEAAAAQARAEKATAAAVDKELGPGRVYQGVSRSIRALTATGTYTDRTAKIDPAEAAGLIALARATARTVDKFTGHNPTGWYANGRDLAPLVEQLRELLAALLGDDPENDPLLEWLAADDAPAEDPAHARG